MSEQPTRRRWFQFSLAAMFVLMLVVAIFISYHVNWIRQRHEFYRAYLQTTQFSPNPTLVAAAPGMLGLFGEEGIYIMDLGDRALAEQMQAKRLFPEAIIIGLD